MPHLSYIGDADIGAGTNIGAGNITANYHAGQKHRTTIGAHVHTSSDTVFVAPVSIGDNAYTVPAPSSPMTSRTERSASHVRVRSTSTGMLGGTMMAEHQLFEASTFVAPTPALRSRRIRSWSRATA